MKIVPVPCLSDNYAYLVLDSSEASAAVVDPSETEPVLDALATAGVELAEIWLTHHHWDHVGGIDGLLAEVGEVRVRGSRYDLDH